MSEAPDPAVEIVYPDGKTAEDGSRYIGLTNDGLPIPERRPSPPGTYTPWEGRTDRYRAVRDAKTQYRNRQRKASRRPGWWSPNGVIERLEDGEKVTDIIQEAVKACGGAVKLRILFRDIQRWKKMIPEFKADYERATHLYEGGALPPSRWDLFFKTMAAFDGKVEMACAALGIGAKVIYGMIDPQFKATYRKDFAERFKRAELDRMAPIRSRLLNNAESERADPKVQLAILEAAMPALHGKKKTLAVEGGIDLRMEQQAAEQQTVRERALFAGRKPHALPEHSEPITIDVVGELVKEER